MGIRGVEDMWKIKHCKNERIWIEYRAEAVIIIAQEKLVDFTK